MTRSARHIAVASIAALAAVAAIIAADFAPPASAQSGDETAGRIVARLLEDGRVEFGWQPADGERILPTQRYFPTDAKVGRWLRSSPVKLAPRALDDLGRIEAQLLDDGRIEFAFTPTDRERILTDARYFPADARPNRWLRSTEITIGFGPSPFVTVSAGGTYTCGLRESGAIECWGTDSNGVTDAPDGRYTTVSAGGAHACAIRAGSGAIECWGSGFADGQGTDGIGNDIPDGRFTAISAGFGAAYACAIHDTGEAECWGHIRSTRTGDAIPPQGSLITLSAGEFFTCAIAETFEATNATAETGEIECWGWDGQSQNTPPDGRIDPPAGRFTAISAGFRHACAIRASDSEIACWGMNDYEISNAAGELQVIETGQTDPPDGRFTAISAGERHTCAIRESGEIACWGLNGYYRGGRVIETGQTDPPAGSYTAVSVGWDHACAIRDDGAIKCWGSNAHGRATPPTE